MSNVKISDQEERRRLRDLRAEREARSLAIEKAYVHDVYEQVNNDDVHDVYKQVNNDGVHDVYEQVNNNDFIIETFISPHTA